MKRNFSVLTVLVAVVMAIAMTGLLHHAHAVPAYPDPVDYRLPDGSTITIQLHGDEWVNWRETADGYTLLVGGNGFLEYAVVDGSGDLKLSGVRARNERERTTAERSFLAGQRKRLRYSRSQVEAMRELRGAANGALRNIGLRKSGSQSAGPENAPVSGTVRVPVILVAFQDKPFTKAKADFEMLFDQLNYTAGGTITGSLRDYFKANSYEKMDLRVDVFGPYTMSKNISAYDNKSPGGDPRDMALEAIVFAASGGCNFANYPDPNRSGYALPVHIIFAGYGQENPGVSPGQSIWSHAWGFTRKSYNGLWVDSYSCSPELRGSSGTNITHIGVVAHELGHSLLGLPDFYDTDNEESGGESVDLGAWDLMAGGSWNNSGATPPYFSAYARAFVGWVTETTLTSYSNITVPNPDPTTATQGIAYRINTPTPNEYFLLENRQKAGWDAYIPASGLLIYHVRRDNLTKWNDNTINADPADRRYYVKQAGCAITNGCETGAGWYPQRTNDPWPRSTFTEFTDASTPNSKSWAGANTDKPVTNITHNTGAKTVSFTFGTPSFAGGDGTSGNPYQIATAAQLANLATLVNVGNTDYNDKFYKLTADINLGVAPYSTGSGWTPIGTQSNPFKGTFDGDGNTISNLFINRMSTYTGLFGYIFPGTVKNLGIKAVDISGDITGTGGVAGYISGVSSSVENCYITGTKITGFTQVGGIVGYNGGSVVNCYSTVAVSGVSASGGIGGIVGSSSGNVNNCAALNVSVSGSSNVGRVVGNNSGTLTGNIAFSGMADPGTGKFGAIINDATDKNGESRTRAALYASTGFPSALTISPWTYAPNKLPGFVAAVDMPAHLQPKALTITGVTAVNRNYDGTTTVALAGGALQGIDDGGDVGFTLGSGTISSTDIGTGKPVTTAIALTGTDVTGYTLTQPSGITVNITARQLTWNANGVVGNKVFDGTAAAVVSVAPTLAGVLAGDVVTPSVGSVSFSDANVGAGKTVTAAGYGITGIDAGNYIAPAAQPAFAAANITKAPASALTATDPAKFIIPMFNTSAQTFNLGGIVLAPANHGARSYTLGAVSNNGGILDGNPTLSGATLTYKGAGKTTGTATQSITITTDNYADKAVTLTFEVPDKDIATVTVTAPSGIIYGASLGNPGAAARNSSGGNVSGASFVYTYVGVDVSYTSTSKPVGVGTYVVRAALDNHATHSGEGVSAEFKISPRALSASWFTVQGARTYNAGAQEPSFVISGTNYGLSADDIDVRYENNVDAGTASVFFKGKGNFESEVSRTFSIGRKAVTVNAGDSEVRGKVYDGTTAVKTENVSVAFNGLEGGQSFGLGDDYTIQSAAFNNAGAGSRSVSVTVRLAANGPTARNYSLSSGSFTKSGVTIDKKDPEASDFTFTIPEDHRFTGRAQGIGSVSGKSGMGAITVFYNGEAGAPSAVGGYSVSVSVAEGSNYNGGTVMLGTYYIGEALPPDITAQPMDTTVRQGNPAALAVIAVSPNNGTLSYQWYRSDETAISGATGNRYSPGTGTQGTFGFYVVVTNTRSGQVASARSSTATLRVIEPAKPLSGAVVTVSGEFTYDGTAKVPTAITVKLGDNTLSGSDYVCEFANNTNAGTATVTVRGTDVYSGTASGTFVIGRSKLERSDVMLTNATSFYSGAAQNASVGLTGGRTGLGAVAVSYNGAVPVNVGEYRVMVSIAAGANFLASDDVFDMGTFTIARKVPAPADVTLKLPAEHTPEGLRQAVNSAALKGTGYGSVTVLFDGSESLPDEPGVYMVMVVVEGGSNYIPEALVFGNYTITDPNVSVRTNDRTIPGGAGEQASVIPSGKLSWELTAGPNPASKSVGKIDFYCQGGIFNDGVLTIYDALGNFVRKIDVTNKTDIRRGGNLPPATASGHVIGSWDLKDAKGRRADAGTYLVRGALKSSDGSTKPVTLIIGIR